MGKILRILLISAVRKPTDWNFIPKPALGLGYIASYLRKYNDITQIKIIERSYEYDTEDLIKKYKPDIIGISSTSQEYNAACSIANKVKDIDKDILAIIGGHHITALPSCMARSMDIGILGEGEETFSEIVKLYEKDNLDDDKLEKVAGIIYWKNENQIMTKRRDLIRPLDNIPFPARDLLKIDKKSSIFTSRGCPYDCIYCSAAGFWHSFRYHSPEYTIKEIKELVDKYQVTTIDLEDDLFIVPQKKVEQLSRLVREEGIADKVIFTCLCRANLLNEEIVKCMKEMNIQYVSIGFESGSESVLQRIKKGSVTVQQNRDAIKLLKKHGIGVHGFFLIGSPDETNDEMLETCKFIRDNPINSAKISVMVPYPGTDVWNYAKSKNIVSENMNWDSFDMDFIENNDKYLIIDDAISKEDLIDMFLRLKNEAQHKLPFHVRHYRRLRHIYNIKIIPNLKKLV